MKNRRSAAWRAPASKQPREEWIGVCGDYAGHDGKIPISVLSCLSGLDYAEHKGKVGGQPFKRFFRVEFYHPFLYNIFHARRGRLDRLSKQILRENENVSVPLLRKRDGMEKNFITRTEALSLGR